MTDLNHSAKAVIDGDAIAIRVLIAALPVAFRASPLTPLSDDAEPLYRVVDEQEFAKSLCRRLNEETETGETAIHRMLDAAMEQVLEQGDEGIEEVAADDAAGQGEGR